MDLLDFFKYGFIWKALLAGVFIALLCSILGVLLVLRRLSLIGDGLAHVAFGSVAVGLIMNTAPLYTALPIVMVSSLGILKLTEKTGLYGDAAIGIVSSVGIAGGVVLASRAGGFNVDLFSYLFGNILAISQTEVVTSIVLAAVVLAVIFLFYNDVLAMTFDEEFARVSGVDTRRIKIIQGLLTAVSVVLTMKVAGIMLTSSLLILPAVTAFQLAKGFKQALLWAASFSVFSLVLGIFISFLTNLPTGATVVLINFLCFLAALAGRRLREGKIIQSLRGRRRPF